MILGPFEKITFFRPDPLPYGRMNHLCCDWNKHMLSIIRNTLCNRSAWWLPLIDERFVIDESVAVSIIFFWTWCDKRCCQAQLHPSNRGRWFFVWGSLIWQAHHYPNQWNTALMEAAIMSKMQTPAITLWFPEQCLLGFFIFEKQLTSQDMFLIRSELSITAYLFLVLYRSTSLQSLSFLKNFETFLCKSKFVNNPSIPSTQQPYNHDSFSKILRAPTALQSQSFCKNIKNFLCK